MSILIDTPVWSLGLRRRYRDLNPAEKRAYFAWEKFLQAGEAALIGPIRQETLSGVISKKEFLDLKAHLEWMDTLFLSDDAFVRAAEFFNVCRGAGVAAGAIDMMICAAAEEHGVEIFTTDPDFPVYARYLPIRLYRA